MGLFEELCIKNDWIEIEETNRLPKFQHGFYINGKIYINSNLSETRNYTKNSHITNLHMGIS